MVEHNMANQKFFYTLALLKLVPVLLLGKVSITQKIILADLKSLLALKDFTNRRESGKYEPLKYLLGNYSLQYSVDNLQVCLIKLLCCQ